MHAILTANRSIFVAKNTVDFLDHLKSGKFDETLKTEKSKI
jgi:hypothetical protein